MKRRNDADLASWSINRPIGTMMLTSTLLVLGAVYVGRIPVDMLPRIVYPQVRVASAIRAWSRRCSRRRSPSRWSPRSRAPKDLERIGDRHLRGLRQRHAGLQVRHERRLRRPGRGEERRAGSRPSSRGGGSAGHHEGRPDAAADLPVAFSSAAARPDRAAASGSTSGCAHSCCRCPGVAALDLYGGLVREIQVELEPTRLRGYGLSVSQVINALRNENQDIAAGRITATDREMIGKTAGKFHSLDDIRGDLLTDAERRAACRCRRSPSCATRARSSGAGGASTACPRCASASEAAGGEHGRSRATACARGSRRCRPARSSRRTSSTSSRTTSPASSATRSTP